MNNDMLLELLDRPIAFHRVFVSLTGSITGAILLSQAYYWQKRCPHADGFWWKTQEQWTDETGMSRKQLDTAKQACGAFLEVVRKGQPPKNWYRLNMALVQSKLSERGNLDCPKGTIENDRKGQFPICTETLSETTTETIQKPPTPLKGEKADDAAIGLVDRFRTKFGHYRVIDNKGLKQELVSARKIINEGLEEEIFELTQALLDKSQETGFRGKNPWVATLTAIVKHLSDLKSEFGTQNSSEGSSSVAAAAAGLAEILNRRDRTPEEVCEERRKHLAYCKREGLSPIGLSAEDIDYIKDVPGALAEFGVKMPQDDLPPVQIPPHALRLHSVSPVNGNGHLKPQLSL